MKKNVKIAIEMLRGILEWSDRIGSDEIAEIQETIKILLLEEEIFDFEDENIN